MILVGNSKPTPPGIRITYPAIPSRVRMQQGYPELPLARRVLARQVLRAQFASHEQRQPKLLSRPIVHGFLLRFSRPMVPAFGLGFAARPIGFSAFRPWSASLASPALAYFAFC